ncbi:hypothetical protein GGI25_002492 [Coemansia spiralis]|uniref:Uncharacterized protein n=2 Tax=Coemansia TaxID=4863 RepID=A0A9W8G8M8_9FUNG|nr:peptidase S28 [Coemansia spiralis]KAJ1995395.1 hypothetical protein EDC05_000947 [Coemansia umbellata]KAJ2624777.1 hypothetical protein GGI26_001193 [Coemansia sp. RSA 1358]KAJ2678320.1 hypothetical protein GGI25_002492 [Coemansia spiralis]
MTRQTVAQVLLAVMLIISATICGKAEPLAVREARLQRVWTEYLLNADTVDNADSPQSAISDEVRRTIHERQTTSNEFYFNQNVDHFGTNSSTFKQRFYINTNNYTPGGPIYLFNSGETPASPSYLFAGEPYTLAKATGGMLIIMEHRYYGVSYPVSDMSGPSMQYLTLENALEDIANFIRNARDFVRASTGTTISPQSKWILTGGSYSANIAVWMRMFYPDLVFAAYASSAPLLASTDFYQYDQVVGRALPCAPQIANAIEVLDSILDYKNRALIDNWKKAFGLEVLANDADFAGALTDQMSNTVQYYMPPAKGSNGTDAIGALCGWFDRSYNHPLQNLADMTAAYIRNNGIDPTTAYSSGSGANNYELYQDGRSWFYQTCAQFGFWQTAPPAPLRRLRSKYVTASWQSGPCKEFFGENITGTPDVAAFNKKYRGLLPNVTRVVFVNGMLDPWSQLSVAVDSSISRKVINQGENVIITMLRASHVTDFYFSSSRTDFGVDVARARILEAIKGFLSHQ